MAWLVLIVSGFFEAGWAVSLKLSDGLSRLWPTVSFLVLTIASLLGLGWAMRFLAAGPAYAVWTGIGASVTAIIGILFLGESVSPLKIASILLIIAGVVGLNLAGGH
ncbi:DMT family transporter [Thermasporomyces composti]|jgi:quaternary ammonium compound-resistance protein SugE|uniref:Quaternary ammonium compound-resistance protein SugE n=1 Tax=Thermasporomyces composti TaxID=696763 RepID=A0A3D9VAB3_THECX|nr:multidrug efflux SMR transporter [Thermasporomyces composti]REF37100.1 quaternary ammonium compound-resistance protein SugE [Thermasporomyces composti]